MPTRSGITSARQKNLQAARACVALRICAPPTPVKAEKVGTTALPCTTYVPYGYTVYKVSRNAVEIAVPYWRRRARRTSLLKSMEAIDIGAATTPRHRDPPTGAPTMTPMARMQSPATSRAGLVTPEIQQSLQNLSAITAAYEAATAPVSARPSRPVSATPHAPTSAQVP